MGYSWGACKRTFTVDVMRRQSASFARGGGGTPLYKPYRYVPSHKQYGFWFLVFAPFSSENFAHFGLESGMVSRELRECTEVFIVSIPNE